MMTWLRNRFGTLTRIQTRQGSESHRLMRWHPSIHRLENRDVPSFTAVHVGDTSTFTGDSADDAVIFDQSGGLIRHNRFTAGDAGFTSDFDFDSTATGDQTLPVASSSSITLNAGDGNDTVTVGSVAAPASGVDGRFIINGEGGTDNVVWDNSADVMARTINIQGGTFNQVLIPSIGASVSFGSTPAEAVSVLAGLGDDAIAVSEVGLVGVSVNAGDGDDTISFTAGATLGGAIDGGAGVDLLDYSAYSTAVHANLGISTTNAATLNGGNEVPANGSTATGTSTLTYSGATGKFDISMTITDISATDAGLRFHIHSAVAGKNGPIIVSLFDAPAGENLGTLTPTASGFTFTATGIPLPGVNEASFLGDNTYLNVHTTAFAGGEIRGQVIRQTQSTTAGNATGASAVSGFESVTGGSAADSLVGSNLTNTLVGGAGNNVMLGGPGGDLFTGGGDNDVMIWANGDGSDVMDGAGGDDTVQVNGAVGATGDRFLVQPNPGALTRVRFDRTNLGLFNLDIGTTENLTLNGNIGADTFTVNDLTGVLNLVNVNANGNIDADTFDVTPSPNVTINVDGDLPAPPTGDILNVITTGTTNAKLTSATSAAGLNGNYSFGNRLPVNFQRVESLTPAGSDLSVTITDNQTTAVPGTSVTYTIVVTNNGPLDVSGVAISSVFVPGLTDATFTAVQSGGATGFSASGSSKISDTVAMPNGSTITYTVTGTIISSGTGTLNVTADVNAPASQPDPDLTDNSASDLDTLTPQANLSVTISDAPDPVLAGKSLIYTITLTHNGPSDALDVQLSTQIPANTTFLSILAPLGWTVTAPAVGGTGLITVTSPPPALAATTGPLVFSLEVKVDADTASATVISNTVTVSSSTTDLNPGDNSASTTTTVSAFGAPLVVGADAGGGPHVQAFDAVTGKSKFSFFAYDARFLGGVRVATGDVTGDGAPDIITGAGPGGGPHVKVFDGLTGAEVRSFFAYDAAFRGGLFVTAGDINGDGFADVITGADAGGGPHVIAFSGKNGSMLASFYAYDAAFTGGVRVAAGDVNADGKSDIVTGAGPGGGPHVIAFSGTNLSLLQTFYAFDPGYTGGVYVSAGNIDSDNQADIITSSGLGGSSVKVFSGKDNSILRNFLARGTDFTAGIRVGVADINGDGQLDIVTGNGRNTGPLVRTFNGVDVSELSNFFAFDPSFLGGVFTG